MAESRELQILLTLKDRASAELKKVGGFFEQHADTFRRVGIGVTAIGGSLAVVSKQFISAAADFEQTQIAFETMLGSAEKANALLKDLAEFGARTPFELKELEEASKKLLAFGIDSSMLISDLTSLGNIAAGVGTDKMPFLINAFGQVAAKGRLMGQELLQFTESGVPLLQELANKFGVTTAVMQEMVSSGQVSFEDVRQTLAGMSDEGGRFFNLMDSQSKTFSGLMSNLKDQIDLFFREGGQPLIEVGKQVVAWLVEVVQKLNDWSKANPELIKIIGVLVVTLTGLTLILGPLLIMLPGLVIAFNLLAVAIGFLLSPIGLVVAAIIGMIAVGFLIVKNWDHIKEKAAQFGAFLTDKFNTIKDAWFGLWEAIGTVATGAFEGIKNTIKSAINWIIDQINSFVRAANKLISAGNVIPGINITRIPEIPKLAKGGIVRKPTLAMIGEAGPEAVVPLNKSGSMGTTVNITVNGDVSGEELVQKVSEGIMQTLRLNQRLAL